MHRLEWQPRQLLAGSPAGTVSPAAGARIRDLAQALQDAARGDRREVSAAAGRLAAALEPLASAPAEPGAPPVARTLLTNVIRAGLNGEYRDYLGAEQAMMAIDVLSIESRSAARCKAAIDDLYRLLRSDETYRSGEFIAALKALDSALGPF